MTDDHHEPHRAGSPPAAAPVTAPYGTWESPITVAALTADTVTLGDPQLDNGMTYWTQARASDGGRTAILRRSGSTTIELTPSHDVRTRVHEYGGGAWHVRGGIVVFSTFPSDAVLRLAGSATPVPITPADAGLRYADLRVHPEHDLVLAVREDHRGEGEPVNTLVALRLSGDNADGGTVLCAGADFYASPELSPDGRLAWVEWDHPNMPWDHTRLCVATLEQDSGAHWVRSPARIVVGEQDEAPMAPSWDGRRLLFFTDRSGYWNLYAGRPDGRVIRLQRDDRDGAGPHWMLGERPYAVLPDGRIALAMMDGGRQRFTVLADGRPGEVPGLTDVDVVSEAVSVGGFAIEGTRLALRLGYRDRGEVVVVHDLTGRNAYELLARSTEHDPPRELVSVPQPVTWDSPDGPVHAWYYPPRNPEFRAQGGEFPPVLTLSHGGPTGVALPTMRLSTQYWTSRGFAVVDVNYGGSAGFGRAYRQRLAGRWGEVDVRDCVHAVRVLIERGLADPERVVIMGGSAGGYTTLRALTSSDVFAVGISLYGIGDLRALARDTHKFESRYLDGLVGPWPQAKAVYEDRSPINHVDRLQCPMLILQGADDKVVPPSQAEDMAAAVRAKGLACELIVFPGEGHGFRRAESIQRTYAEALRFCLQTFGLAAKA